MAPKITLRALELRDAPLMLEWMHDSDVVRDLRANFAAKTLDDCLSFIEKSKETARELNLAVADESGEYMGTVSLKNINREAGSAELAIVVRACAMGRGFSAPAMKEIIRIGLCELGLEKVYWCVSADNKRAVRFYDKNNWRRISSPPAETRGYTEEQLRSYIWYAAERQEGDRG